LTKITTRCGTSAIDGLNEALLAKAAQAKVLKMAKAIKSLQAKGLARRTKFRNGHRLEGGQRGPPGGCPAPSRRGRPGQARKDRP
jgi:hypothetical protein